MYEIMQIMYEVFIFLSFSLNLLGHLIFKVEQCMKLCKLCTKSYIVGLYSHPWQSVLATTLKDYVK